jgi:alpha-methylacyl-CoA racemase
LRVIELAGIGPGPHAAMILADLGADVIRVERPGPAGMAELAVRDDLLLRNRRAVVADLKDAGDLGIVLSLTDRADVLIEGMRPGVAERLGVGPEACRARNPALVYARITGWGQSGPLAARAGHDINYIGLTGVLAAIGRAGQRPVPPLNLVGDFGGGSMLAVVGILAVLFAGVDACVTPVLDLDEAPRHPQVGGRGSVTFSDGAYQAAPAPRFSRTPGMLRPGSRITRKALADVAREWSVD